MNKLPLEKQLIKIKRRQVELLTEILRYANTLRGRNFRNETDYIQRVVSVSSVSFIDSCEIESINLDYFLVSDVALNLFESEIKKYYVEYNYKNQLADYV